MRLNNQSIHQIFNSKKIPLVGQQYVHRVRSSSGPAQNTSGAFGNTAFLLSSRKMKFTLDAHSRYAEWPFLLHCEFSAAVLEVYDQPEQITIRYENASGKWVGHKMTCDYLIITEDGVFLVECKKEEELETLRAANPNKYTKNSQGIWICPPAQAAASEMGLKHIVYTDRSFSTVFTRNSLYLFNFVDDLEAGNAERFQKIYEHIIKRRRRVRLSELNQRFGQDVVMAAILARKVHVNLKLDLLKNADQTWVYASNRYLNLISRNQEAHSLIPLLSAEELSREKSVFWNASQYDILDYLPGPTGQLTIRKGHDQIIKLTRTEVDDLIESEDLYVPERKLCRNLTDAEQKLLDAPLSALEEAKRREALVLNLNAEELIPSKRHRSLRRWRSQYRVAKRDFGIGLIGLLPNTKQRGNRKPRLNPLHDQIISELIEQRYLSKVAPTGYEIYNQYQEEAEKKFLTPCSLRTFYKKIDEVDLLRKTLKRQGGRAAYMLGPQPLDIDLDWTLPAHGDHAFQVAHIDHTPLEIVLISKLDGKPINASPNLTIMHDAYSRKILAAYISFEKPSYRSTMMVLRECNEQHGRLPIFIAVDRGSDFQSHYFDSTLARLKINKIIRPPGAARHGSVIERLFGVSEKQLIHLLQGNKKLQKLGRSQSTSHKPSKLAVWAPDDFAIAFKTWAYDSHPHIENRGIRETPEERFKRSTESFDIKPGLKIESKSQFAIDTLPYASPNERRQLRSNLVEFKGMTYRLTKSVHGYQGEKVKVPVKYDPYDISYIYVELKDRWVKLATTDVLVQECHDKKIKMPHMEVYPRQARTGRNYRKGKRYKQPVYQRIKQMEEKYNALGTNHEVNANGDENTGIRNSFTIDLGSLRNVAVANDGDAK